MTSAVAGWPPVVLVSTGEAQAEISSGEGQAAARGQELAARNRSAHAICAPHLTAV